MGGRDMRGQGCGDVSEPVGWHVDVPFEGNFLHQIAGY